MPRSGEHPRRPQARPTRTQRLVRAWSRLSQRKRYPGRAMTRDEEQAAVDAARAGDAAAIGPLLDEFRPRLGRMVAMRMDARLAGRFDASDVIQEAYVEVTERLPSYLTREDGTPFYLWVRFLVGQKLLQLHRKHLGAQRAALRDVPLSPRSAPGVSSLWAASALVAHSASPSLAVARDEERERLRQALEDMGELDREVLVLRHFEQLSNAEVAQVLDLTPKAASARYVRALARLQLDIDG